MVDSTSLAQNILFIQIGAFMYIKESRPLSEDICTDQEDQVVAAVDTRLTPQNLGFAQLERKKREKRLRSAGAADKVVSRSTSVGDDASKVATIRNDNAVRAGGACQASQ